jgi:hypothetical protein
MLNLQHAQRRLGAEIPFVPQEKEVFQLRRQEPRASKVALDIAASGPIQRLPGPVAAGRDLVSRQRVWPSSPGLTTALSLHASSL